MVGFAAVVAVAVAVAVCCTFLLRMNAEILINIAGIIFAKTTQTKIFQILVLINENMLNRQTCWQVVIALSQCNVYTGAFSKESDQD